MRLKSYLRRSPRILLVFVFGMALWAADNDVKPSTSSIRSPRKKTPSVQRRLRAAGEKVLTPNPRFEGPRSKPMPTSSPTTPHLTPLPPETAPSAVDRFFRQVAKVMTTTWNSNIFVWLPAFSTDPNTGPTYGILPVLVLSDQATHHIRHLLAPSYTYNELFGQTVTGRYYFYPTDKSQLYTVASYSAHTNREFKVRYEDSAFLGGRAFIRSEAFYDVDGSLRFFGVGPDTPSDGESGYTGRDQAGSLDMGVNFLKYLRAAMGVRFRRLGIDPNIIPDVADLSVRYPTFADQADENTVVQEFHLLWDSRDFPVTPSRGSSGEVFFEKTTRAWGSDADYLRYGLEGKRYFPWKEGKENTVIHGLYDWSNGSNIPFYELTTLGGRDTLRGYGEGRFSDRGRILFNVEHRYELVSLDLMGVTTRFELGPFFDIGTVFPRVQDIQSKDLRPVFGGAFRAVVKPNVVGSVDVGVGKEGVGVYVGINYPF